MPRSKDTLLEAALERHYQLVTRDDTATESARRAADSLVRYCTKPDPDSSAPAAPAPRGRVSALPLPRRGVGEGRGEGHPLRASSSPRATDSEVVSTEKSVRSRKVSSALPLPLGEGRGEGHQPTPAPDDDDRRLNAALDILRRANPDIDYDDNDFDDDADDDIDNLTDDTENLSVGCPGQRGDAQGAQSAGPPDPINPPHPGPAP